MKALTCIEQVKFALVDKPKPVILDPRDAVVRVTVNVETFCGECFFCQHGFVNNCTDRSGGWSLGCRIDGGQAEFVRVPYADQGLNRIPDSVFSQRSSPAMPATVPRPVCTHWNCTGIWDSVSALEVW